MKSKFYAALFIYQGFLFAEINSSNSVVNIFNKYHFKNSKAETVKPFGGLTVYRELGMDLMG